MDKKFNLFSIYTNIILIIDNNNYYIMFYDYHEKSYEIIINYYNDAINIASYLTDLSKVHYIQLPFNKIHSTKIYCIYLLR